ncbi:MAG: hypothetical protein IT385_30530 [Deltaproteobacteria bacterium]|nr:hypothetical protein [Deltaproteobacteria bacterium]
MASRASFARSAVAGFASLLVGCGDPSQRSDDHGALDVPSTTETRESDIAAVDTAGETPPVDAEAAEVVPVEVVAGCDACALGCCGEACCALDPSQAAIDSLGDGQGTFTIGAALAFDTGRECAGDTALGACERVAIREGHVVCVCRVDVLEVTGRLEVTGSEALVVLARTGITIEGTLDVSGVGTRSGPGGGWSYDALREGRAGGKGGSFASVGGGGDPVLGAEDLEPLTAGCSGQATSAEPTLGGGRGGALQLSAGEHVTVRGSVLAHGGGGGGGVLAGGGGGGSGGAILIEAPRVAIIGVVAAHGGGGGGAAGDGGAGTPGEDGRHDRAALGGAGRDGSGCEEHGFLSGGDGGAGAFGEAEAMSGELGASEYRCGPDEAWVGGGGGGGGLGRIRIRSLTPCECTGLIAPTPRLDAADIR